MNLTSYGDIDDKIGILMVALRSKSSQMSSIYSIEYDKKMAYLMSGRNVMLNLKGNIMAIFPTEFKDIFLVQTTNNIIVWSIELKGKEAALDVS